jgi:uncharacterized membrane protein
MKVRLHEMHAAIVHLPLALLPATLLVDVAAVVSGNGTLARTGTAFWWAMAGSGVLAGLTGMSASQQVKAEDRTSNDMIWVHAAGNAVLVLSAIGVATFRTFRGPSLIPILVGLTALGASLYTASLGGKMVYGRGIGVESMPPDATTGVKQSPPVLSPAAPFVFVRDVVKGLGWFLSRAADLIKGRAPLAPGAFGFGSSREEGRHEDNPK